MKPRALASQLKDRVRVQRPIDTHSPMGAVLAELQTISWGWGKLEANFGRDKLLATEVRDPGVDLSEVTGTLTVRAGLDIQPGDVAVITTGAQRQQFNVVAVAAHKEDSQLKVCWLSAVSPHPFEGGSP